MISPDERSAYYRWEFGKWYQTAYPSLCCPGGLAIKTNHRSEWLCSGCAEDISLEVVIMYQLTENHGH